MASGVVRAYDGYENRGFISPDDGGGEVVFTPAAIVGVESRALEVGARVRFDVLPTALGFRAENIRRL